AVAGLIAERLIGLYPEQKSLIEKNVHSFNDKNAEIDRELKRSLQPYQSTGFLAYHNAYGYFVRHYDLHQLGVIQQQGGRTLSVKHLLELQALIEPGEAVCVF